MGGGWGEARIQNLKSLVEVLCAKVSSKRRFEGMGGLNVMEVRRERFPLLWRTVSERALAKGKGAGDPMLLMGRSNPRTRQLTNLKQSEAQSARAESTHKGVNQHSKYVTQAQQQRPESPSVTLTWHPRPYKAHKLHQRYIKHSNKDLSGLQ